MAALPYIQLYVADYLADTMHLSTEEHGAYLLLIFNYWQTGKPIPKNRLAKIARLTNERWISVESSLSEFFTDNGTEWVHERIERDLGAVHAAQNQRSAAGRASAQARKNRKSPQSQLERNERSTGVEVSLNEKATNKDTDTDTDTDTEKNKTTSHIGEESAPATVKESLTVQEPDQGAAPSQAAEQTTRQTGKAGKGKPAQADGFAEFWMAYPRKAAKADAEKAWNKLRPDRTLQAEILASLAKQTCSKGWAKDNGKFIPHPATWLNGRRWLDELSPQPASRHHGFGQIDYREGLQERPDGTFAF